MLGSRLCRWPRVAWPQRARDTATSGERSTHSPRRAHAQLSPSGRLAARPPRRPALAGAHSAATANRSRRQRTRCRRRPAPGAGRLEYLELGGLERRDQRPGRAHLVDHDGARLPLGGQLDQARSDTSDILANDLKTTGTMYLTVRSSDKYIEISGVTFTQVS
jgi:hypothetical protein